MRRTWSTKVLVVAVSAMTGTAFMPVASQAATLHHATLSTFAGSWIGHTRGLRISHKGHAKESVGDGCCDPVIDLTFRLSDPRGTTAEATAKATVTSVHVHDRKDFSHASPPPHVGEVRRIRLKHGVITESLTQNIYCDPAAEAKGTCGA